MRSILFTAILATLPLSAQPYYPQWVRTGPSTPMSVGTVAAGDFNGDGRPDVIVRSGNNVHLLPTQAGGIPGASVLAFSSDYLSDLELADFDGDQKLDIVASDIAKNALLFVKSNGNGTFAAPITTSLPFSPTQLATADFNGDGRMDVAILSRSAKTLAIFRGDGSGGFTEASRRELSLAYWIRAHDVDHDGRVDVLIARDEPLGFDLFFGKSDGTLDAPTPFTNPSTSSRFALADLDADGDAEILSADFPANTLTVMVNLGSRTFAAPVVYPLIVPTHPSSGNPWDLFVTDIDGDGKVDVVVSLTNEQQLATLSGNGNGSLAAPVHAWVVGGTPSSGFFPGFLAAADFTRDGRTDLVVASANARGVAIHANAAGDAHVQLTAKYPVVSAGDPIPFRASVGTAEGFISLSTPPFPTGAVTLQEGATVLATATPQNRELEIEAPPLPVGTHAIRAHFAGDESYRSGVSSETLQKVVAEKTTTTLTLEASGPSIPYGEGFVLRVAVESPIAGSVLGSFWLFIDGVRQQYTQYGPPTYWSLNHLPPGTYTFYTEYEGNDTQPPSRSNVVTQVIRKAQSVTAIEYGGGAVAGRPVEIRVDLHAFPHGGTPGGWVRVYEGAKLLAKVFADNRCCSGGMTVTVKLPPFPEGTHQIHATYAGDDNFEPSVSQPQTVVVAPGTVYPRRRRSRS